jgi:hypothetical protein
MKYGIKSHYCLRRVVSSSFGVECPGPTFVSTEMRPNCQHKEAGNGRLDASVGILVKRADVSTNQMVKLCLTVFATYLGTPTISLRAKFKNESISNSRICLSPHTKK